jgi:myo-inositol-1-phosphate synthase
MATAHLAGRRGPCRELAFFFEDPIDTAEHRLIPQYDELRVFAHDPGRER